MPALGYLIWIGGSAAVAAVIGFVWNAADVASTTAGKEAGKQIASTERTLGSGLNLILLAGVGLATFFLVSEALKK